MDFPTCPAWKRELPLCRGRDAGLAHRPRGCPCHALRELPCHVFRAGRPRPDWRRLGASLSGC
ncbi:unnamed protein product [Symbiodinium microadriaticum]|nr:unnamed protein product [Symbiodinium microadriaticum]CAE7942178.1 unnamed protein product [Symbiodinium sp. KB8]